MRILFMGTPEFAVEQLRRLVEKGHEICGVFFGQIAGRNGQEVKLRNVRKLWYWEGACAVEQLAVDGVTVPSECKFTVVVSEMVVTDAIQILPCSDNAAKILGEVKAWKR